jgi:hypothetical protein
MPFIVVALTRLSAEALAEVGDVRQGGVISQMA